MPTNGPHPRAACLATLQGPTRVPRVASEMGREGRETRNLSRISTLGGVETLLGEGISGRGFRGRAILLRGVCINR